MIVYHGSIFRVESPLVNIGRPLLDFGPGFYVTELMQQAVSWACRPLNDGKRHYLNIYDLDVEGLKSAGVGYLKFPEYSGDWLDFVVSNRKGGNMWKSYSVIEGGIANDHVFNTVELYSDELITKNEALDRLKYEKPNHQICINRQDVLDKFLFLVECRDIDVYGK